MKKRTRLIILGALVVALIAAIVGVVQYNNYQASLKEEESSSVVFKNLWQNNREDIESVRLDTREDSITMVPQQGEDGKLSWVLKGHEDWALRHTYNNIIMLGANFDVFLEIEQNVTDTARKKDFGLDKPTSVITVTLKDGTQMQALIGNRSSDGAYCFCMMTGDDTVYACNSTYIDYAGFTTDSLRLQEITEIDVKESHIYSLFAQKKGERPIRIQYDEKLSDDAIMLLLYSPYQLTEPYDSTLEALASLQEGYFETLTTPEFYETIEADCQNFDKYGLGDEPEYRETIVSRKVSGDDYVYNTTDYIFGYRYGDKDQYIYFRQGDSNHVMGVHADVLEKRHFDSFYFINKLVFKAPIRDVTAGTVSYQGKEHNFSIRRQENVSEDDSGAITVYRFDGELIDSDIFSALYKALYSIAPDYEILDEVPEYDENDRLEFQVTNMNGEKSSVTYYRLSEFYYVTQIEENTWFACSSNYVKDVATALQACVDAVSEVD